MGFSNRESNKFFTIYGGKFSRKVDKDTEGAVMRTNKLGNTVYELYNDRFTGLLTNIRIKEGDEYGDQWLFDFLVEGNAYTLALPYASNFAIAILKILPNLDVTKEFTMEPSIKIENDKTFSTLFVNQDGTAIKHAHTRENPNGMPDLELVKIKGKDTWDNTKRIEFLKKNMEENILPTIKENNFKYKESVDKVVEPADFDNGTESELSGYSVDDLDL